MPYWNFVDCNEAWPWDPENGSICEPAGTKEGNSSILTLQYAYGLDLAIQLFSYTGNTQQAEKFKKIKDDLIAATFNLCWDAEKNLMADTPEKTGFSQHANIFAALTGQIPLKGEDQKNYILNMFKNEDLIQASTQSQAYYHKVLKQYGLQNYYLNYIGKWKQLIDWGFTTFPEYPELNTRSDCHAWSAYPAYEMLTMVCGISITSPGFQSVEISPAPGDLDWIEGAMPWKDSFIVVNLKKTNRRLKGTIRIPEGLKADFSYSGERFKLQSGENVINVKN